jgi:thioredoxin reductase (NADPH)
VTLIHRSQFRASSRPWKSCAATVKLILSRIQSDEGQRDGNALTSVEIENLKTGKTYEFPTEGPSSTSASNQASQLYRGQLEIDKSGYLIAGEDTKTSVEGVFAAGDFRDKPVRRWSPPHPTVRLRYHGGTVYHMPLSSLFGSITICQSYID